MAWSLARPSRRKNEPGNLAGRVGPLLDVDGEREEVGTFAHRARCGRGGEHHGVANAAKHGAVGQLGKLAGLKAQAFGRSR